MAKLDDSRGVRGIMTHFGRFFLGAGVRRVNFLYDTIGKTLLFGLNSTKLSLNLVKFS